MGTNVRIVEAFYQFTQECWKHLRTTNVGNRRLPLCGLRTDAAKRYKKVENASVVICKMLMRCRRLEKNLNHI